MANRYASQTSYNPHGAGPSPVALVPPFSGHSGTPVFYPAGTEIYAQGERCGNLYRVEFGAVRVYHLLSDGRRQISAFHLSGEIFGFETGTVHQFFAESICGTGVSTLRSTSTPGGYAAELFPVALKSLLRAQAHLLVLGRQNAVERVAAFLLEMSERQGDLKHIDLPMSRSDVADYLGLTIETVSRVLSRLRLEGVIRLPDLRSVEVVKRQALEGLAA